MDSKDLVGGHLPYYYDTESGQHLMIEKTDQGVKICVTEDVDGACIIVPFEEINRVLGLI